MEHSAAPFYGRQLYPVGQVVITSSHKRARLLKWRENLERWDARYLNDRGEQGQPVLLDPRQCTPVSEVQ